MYSVILVLTIDTCSFMYLQDQYGNYVVQHVLDHGLDKDKSKIGEFFRATYCYSSYSRINCN